MNSTKPSRQAMLKQDASLGSLPDENDQFLAPPLCLAAIAGNIEVARILLDAGVDVDLGDVDESTPLHVAALNRNAEMVTFLLENGADINRRDKNGGYA
ncbi:ankyrin repeat domain-containing protein, partial [Candidatus Eisenbacteria bacterium]